MKFTAHENFLSAHNFVRRWFLRNAPEFYAGSDTSYYSESAVLARQIIDNKEDRPLSIERFAYSAFSPALINDKLIDVKRKDPSLRQAAYPASGRNIRAASFRQLSSKVSDYLDYSRSSGKLIFSNSTNYIKNGCVVKGQVLSYKQAFLYKVWTDLLLICGKTEDMDDLFLSLINETEDGFPTYGFLQLSDDVVVFNGVSRGTLFVVNVNQMDATFTPVKFDNSPDNSGEIWLNTVMFLVVFALPTHITDKLGENVCEMVLDMRERIDKLMHELAAYKPKLGFHYDSLHLNLESHPEPPQGVKSPMVLAIDDGTIGIDLGLMDINWSDDAYPVVFLV